LIFRLKTQPIAKVHRISAEINPGLLKNVKEYMPNSTKLFNPELKGIEFGLN